MSKAGLPMAGDRVMQPDFNSGLFKMVAQGIPLRRAYNIEMPNMILVVHLRAFERKSLQGCIITGGQCLTRACPSV
jgi:hypothetical protein